MNARRLLLPLALLGALSLSGCYTAKIYVAPANAPQGQKRDSYAWAFLWGLYTPNTVDAAQMCNNHVYEVRTRLNLFSMIVSYLTVGIVEPVAVKVTCQSTR